SPVRRRGIPASVYCLSNNVKISQIAMKLQKRWSGDQYSEQEGRTVTSVATSVAAEFGINKSVVSRAWKAFQITGTAVRKVGGGRPRTTTAGYDRFIILQAKRGRRQSASSLQQRGRQVSRFTVARRLHKGGLTPAVLNAASR
ncbi:transposable element Tcb2 transposase, partial [Trichonephila clavipes]